MAKLDDRVLIVDVESTCWEAPEHPLRNEVSEIIEIGLAVVDITKLEIVGSQGIMIRPEYSRVSKFCTKLTTLTQEDVDKGETFPHVANSVLNRDFGSLHRAWVSWGDYDRSMFEKMSELHKVPSPFRGRHLNLRNLFTMFYGLKSEPGMERALEMLNMPLQGTHHRGIDDARNIANIYIHMLKKFRGV